MANLSEFGSSLETTREWISELMETLNTDEARACRALRVTLHELRDHLTVGESADIAAQMPLLLRGVFYEGWRPAGKPVERCSKEEFLEKIGESFKDGPHVGQVEKMVRDVFTFLHRRVSAGEIRDVVTSLPKGIRSLWPAYSGERCSA